MNLNFDFLSGVPFVRFYLMLAHFVTKPEHPEVFDWAREKTPIWAINYFYLRLFASTPALIQVFHFVDVCVRALFVLCGCNWNA